MMVAEASGPKKFPCAWVSSVFVRCEMTITHYTSHPSPLASSGYLSRATDNNLTKIISW